MILEKAGETLITTYFSGTATLRSGIICYGVRSILLEHTLQFVITYLMNESCHINYSMYFYWGLRR
jgi:hypothetical protein